jgi:hypothetical protein
MSAARAAGIETPQFWLSDDGGLFVVERFDLKEGGAERIGDALLTTLKQNRARVAEELWRGLERELKLLGELTVGTAARRMPVLPL